MILSWNILPVTQNSYFPFKLHAQKDQTIKKWKLLPELFL